MHARNVMVNILFFLLIVLAIFSISVPVALLSLPPMVINMLQAVPMVLMPVALWLFGRMTIRYFVPRTADKKNILLFLDGLLALLLVTVASGLIFQWSFILGISQRDIEGLGMRFIALVSLIYSVVIISLVFSHRLRMTTFEALALSSVPLATVIMNALFFTNSLFFGIALSTSILVIYFIIQSRRFGYDQLTQLKNRAAFLTEFEKSIEHGKEGRLCVIDFKDFRFFNQKFGQDVGDELLHTVGTWLASEVGERQAFRFSGDQFAAIQYHSDINEALQSANNLHARFEQPWQVSGQTVFIEARTVLVFFPEHVKTTEEAVNAIAFTLDQAKKTAGGKLTIFDGKEMAKAKRRQEVTDALRRYMQQNKPILYYQPVFSIATGNLYSAEALLRIIDPDLGTISPTEFIPIAEQDGMIVDLTYRIIEEVCSVWKELGEYKHSLSRIMINLSSMHFSHEDMAQRISDIILDSGIEPSLIGFEITESMVIESFDRVGQVMNTLTELGCNFYLDDYGTGYSNIEHLMKLKFETVKLDRSIIIHYAEHPQVLESVVTMLQKIDKKIVAEGVESEDQLTILKKLKVDYVQGFLFSKPIPRTNFCDMIRSDLL